MNHITRSTILASLFALTLCACASTPVKFYTLVKPAPMSDSAATTTLEILPVTIPAQVDVPQLVVRQGPGEMALVEGRQWIAPLADEIRAALTAELRAQLAGRRLAQPYRLKLEVRRFESQLDRAAQIEAQWTLRTAQQTAAPRACFSRVEETVGAGYAALVEGHQRALAKLAAQIALSLTANTPQCPP